MAEKILCIYHGNCADGFGAAWVIRRRFGDGVEFHAGVYGQPPPDVTGREVIVVDFSYKRDVLEKMGWRSKAIVVLDHHKTAAADLGCFCDFRLGKHKTENARLDMSVQGALMEAKMVGLPPIAVCFDTEHSGAMLAWLHYFPDQEPPALLRHIEDRDLWRFALEGTREIQANVFSYPYDFEVWDRLMATDTATLRSDGAAIERKHHKDIAELVRVTKRRMMIGGVDVPVANLPYTLSSDAGHLMAQGEPFAACYWDTADGRVFSLRSSDFGQDVSAVAASYGGGGHRNAAGFSVPRGHDLDN